MYDVEKESLANIVYEFCLTLKDKKEYLSSEIKYNQDLIEIQKKHNKNSEEARQKFEEAQTMLTTTVGIEQEFISIMDGEDVYFDDLEKFIKGKD